MPPISASHRSTFEQTQQEHEQLRERIRFLHQRMEDRPAEPGKITALLRELRDALEAHFRGEECDGFFDQIVTRAPQLSRLAQKLTQEHADMLRQADSLILIAAADASTIPADLISGFQAFSKLLMRHESEENSMLQSAYQDDLGTKD